MGKKDASGGDVISGGASRQIKSRAAQALVDVAPVGDNRNGLTFDPAPPIDVPAPFVTPVVPSTIGNAPFIQALPTVERPLLTRTDDLGDAEIATETVIGSANVQRLVARPLDGSNTDRNQAYAILDPVIDRPPLPNDGNAVDRPSMERPVNTGVPDAPPPPNPPGARRLFPPTFHVEHHAAVPVLPGLPQVAVENRNVGPQVDVLVDLSPPRLAPNAPNADGVVGTTGGGNPPLATNGQPLTAPVTGSSSTLMLVVGGLLALIVVVLALFGGHAHAGGSE